MDDQVYSGHGGLSPGAFATMARRCGAAAADPAVTRRWHRPVPARRRAGKRSAYQYPGQKVLKRPHILEISAPLWLFRHLVGRGGALFNQRAADDAGAAGLQVRPMPAKCRRRPASPTMSTSRSATRWRPSPRPAVRHRLRAARPPGRTCTRRALRPSIRSSIRARIIVADNMTRPGGPGIAEYAAAVRAKPDLDGILVTVASSAWKSAAIRPA